MYLLKQGTKGPLLISFERFYIQSHYHHKKNLFRNKTQETVTLCIS